MATRAYQVVSITCAVFKMEGSYLPQVSATITTTAIKIAVSNRLPWTFGL